MLQILKRPLFTEKATALQEARSQYAFEVDPKANKIQIKQAIEQRFDVKVKSVRTVRLKPKRKVQMTRRGIFNGKTAFRKKAYVTLNEGYTIEIVDSGNKA